MNSEQLLFNWQLGRDLVLRRAEETWEKGVVIPKQIASEKQRQKLKQLDSELSFPDVFGYVPWMHHVLIIQKCKTAKEALFYIQRTIENGWSRRALDDNVRSDLFHAAGAAVTNYMARLPLPQGKLAQELTKSNYDLGFLTLPEDYDEQELETALEHHMTRFLLDI